MEPQMYHCGNTVIASSHPLPLVPTFLQSEPDIIFHLHLRSKSDPRNTSDRELLASARDMSFLRISKEPDFYTLDFLGEIRFQVDSNLKCISCQAAAGTSLETIKHLLLDHVLPRVFSQRGDLVLHAGAVASNDSAFGFMGESGTGKSTLTGALCRSGYRFVSDDFLVVRQQNDHFVGLPSYPGLRLWPDSRNALGWEIEDTTPIAHYSSKERLDDWQTFALEPIPLKTLFVLRPVGNGKQEEITHFRRLKPREAMSTLLSSSFALDITNQTRNRNTFLACAQLSRSLRIFELSYLAKIDFLPDVRLSVSHFLADEFRSSCQANMTQLIH